MATNNTVNCTPKETITSTVVQGQGVNQEMIDQELTRYNHFLNQTQINKYLWDKCKSLEAKLETLTELVTKPKVKDAVPK